MRSPHAALVAALLVVPCVVPAQDASDSAAYRALTQTPSAALPSPFDVGITGEAPRGVGVRVRYGIMSFDTHEYTHDFGVGVEIPIGRASLSLTGGYYWPNCTDSACHSHVMAGVGLSQSLVAIPLGQSDDRGSFTVGLLTEAGFARPGDTTLVAGEASLPLGLVPSKRNLRFVPYVSPGVGVGLVRDGSGTEAGLQFTFNAGVGLLTAGGFAANVGISRVFLSGGNWLVGVGLAFGGGPR